MGEARGLENTPDRPVVGLLFSRDRVQLVTDIFQLRAHRRQVLVLPELQLE